MARRGQREGNRERQQVELSTEDCDVLEAHPDARPADCIAYVRRRGFKTKDEPPVVQKALVDLFRG